MATEPKDLPYSAPGDAVALGATGAFCAVAVGVLAGFTGKPRSTINFIASLIGKCTVPF